MATKVKQTYGSTYAQSVTTRNGVVSKFTIWLPGVSGSTQSVSVPKAKR